LTEFEDHRAKFCQERAGDFLLVLKIISMGLEALSPEVSQLVPNALIKEIQYENIQDSYAIIFCQVHDFTEIKKVENYMQAVYGMSCSSY
jgi:SpoU rRNA methylase family enzyme